MKSITYIKAQLAKLRTQQVEILSSKKGGGGGYSVKKSGDRRVAFIGYPSVGKSSLLNVLTEGRTHSKVAAYDFTTVSAIPGMMEIEGAKIQLIDLPGIILGAAQGKGRGKEVLGTARTADLILIIICFKEDGTLKKDDLYMIREELYKVGIRLNQSPPRMEVVVREKGGIGIVSSVKQPTLDDDTIKSVMNEYKIRNAGIYLYEPLDTDRFIDGVLGNRHYTKELVIVNKSDLAKSEELAKLPELFKDTKYVPISVTQNTGIIELKKAIFSELELIRVYMKEPGKEPDMKDPMILKKGATLETVCLKIHKDFVRLFRFANVWGPSAKHPGQRFMTLDHKVEDGDIIMLTLKR